MNEYVYLELASLEREQADIDNEAAGLEVRLRRAMNEGKSIMVLPSSQQLFFGAVDYTSNYCILGVPVNPLK